MIKFAITGNIASGKSYAYKIIKESGYSIIDCDDIVNKLYRKKCIIEKICKIFPEVITNKKIDKKKLCDILFKSGKTKKDFEKFLYPYVLEYIKLFFEKNKKDKYLFVIVPMLFESGFEKYFDKIILIKADEDIRKKRLLHRNSLLSDYAKAVIKFQISEEKKISKCDYVIENNGSLESFKTSIENFLTNIAKY